LTALTASLALLAAGADLSAGLSPQADNKVAAKTQTAIFEN
jgi:hypothetical protein